MDTASAARQRALQLPTIKWYATRFLLWGYLILASANGWAQERSYGAAIDELLDRPLHTTVVDGDIFLQRDLTDYLNLTLGEPNANSDDVKSDISHDNVLLVRSYFMRPHPSVSTMRKYFDRAAAEFGVPVELLMIVGQIESNWTQIGPSIDQGWGVMHLVQNTYCNTLGEAALLIGVPGQILKDDAEQNIRGAAALIAQYAGADRAKFRELADWLPALAKFSGLINPELREMQARNYLETLSEGVSAGTVWGEVIVVEKMKTGLGEERRLRPDASHGVVAQPKSADYPPALTDSAPSCNYETGRNHTIDTWVNHWIGTGTYLGAISWFNTCPGSGSGQRGYIPGTTTLYGPSSAHFVIKNNGEITQMVAVANTAYHSGASGYPYNNSRSIGVEHEATAANPGMWNSSAMLNASATMARYFKNQYGFPATQNASPGISGHNDMPGTSTECPGPLPWSTWMSYFNAGGGTAPSNDNCSGATSLTVSTSCSYTSGSVLNATVSGLSKPSCDVFGSPNMFDVWYKFTAVATSQTVTVNPSTSGGDPVVSAYGSCGGSAIGCADNGNVGVTETLSLTGLTVGNTYYVRVYDYGSAEPIGADANFQICVTGTAVTNYTLSVTGGGTGTGTVTGSGINCTINGGSTSGTCSVSLASGSAVSLSATPTGGSAFSGWGGSCSGSGGCSFTMSSNRSVSASFTAPVTNYTLSVTGGGTGQGTVTGSGINCTINGGSTSGTCSVSLASGTSVSLSATPTGGSSFSGWGGACSGSGSCSFTMNSNKNVSASFVALVTNDNCSGATSLTVSASCSYTSGSVLNATASGLSKPSCDAHGSPNMFDVWYKFTAVATSQTVTVKPSTSGGDPVVSVYGSCGGSAIGCVDGGDVGVTETLSLTGLTVGNTYYVRVYDYGSAEPIGADANFQICVTGTAVTNYTLSVTGGGTGTGTVTGNGINCTINGGSTSGTCSVSLASGTAVSLSATPTGGSSFSGWGGACSGIGSCSFTMSSNKSVSASFTAPVTNYTLSVTGGGTGQGTVTGSGINCTINGGSTSGTCSVSLASGTSVSLSATPTGGSSFSGWGGACSGNGSCSFTMNSNKSVSASFTAPAANYTLSVTGGGTGQGTVTGSGINCTINSGSTSGTCSASYPSGTSVSLVGTAASGSTFAGWSGEGCSGSGTCQVTMSQARIVVATFTSGSGVIPIFTDGFEAGFGGFANWSWLTLGGRLAASGDSDLQPYPWYYTPTSGVHTGQLVGPAGADFDLFLYHWDPSTATWELVASATSLSNQETISYPGGEGFYVFEVNAYSGSGDYVLSFNIP